MRIEYTAVSVRTDPTTCQLDKNLLYFYARDGAEAVEVSKIICRENEFPYVLILGHARPLEGDVKTCGTPLFEAWARELHEECTMRIKLVAGMSGAPLWAEIQAKLRDYISWLEETK